MPVTKQQVLDYHLGERPGKIEVTRSKPCRTQKDLSLAYTPGVADPCLEIAKNLHDAFKYTARGNLVAVVSNGTAVLGLGDIGALAGKPVMEGKGVLFKRFADVDVFDLEVNSHDPEDVIKAVPVARVNIRRNQSRGHQGTGVLPHRRDAEEDDEEDDEDSGLP
jgi:malate dehydrogenase (oxaloacetate-decarboxylating)(NADP+)